MDVCFFCKVCKEGLIVDNFLVRIYKKFGKDSDIAVLINEDKILYLGRENSEDRK